MEDNQDGHDVSSSSEQVVAPETTTTTEEQQQQQDNNNNTETTTTTTPTPPLTNTNTDTTTVVVEETSAMDTTTTTAEPPLNSSSEEHTDNTTTTVTNGSSVGAGSNGDVVEEHQKDEQKEEQKDEQSNQQEQSIQQEQKEEQSNQPKQKPTITILKSPPVPLSSIASVMPAIGKRLNVAIDQLEARITSDKYDTEAWTLLLNEVQSQPINIARDIYERFLAVFPTAGRYWKLYVEQEMAAKNNEQVEKIFVRALRSVRNVELWRTYIQYIRSGQQNDREEVIKAFELALEYIGMDIASTPVWIEKALLEGILRNMLAKPPRASDKEAHQVRLWRRLIAYEKTNPQRFDAVQLRNRVTATYNQCLLCLYFYPDIWHEAACYQVDVGSVDAACQFYERGLTAIPNSLFLSFSHADVLESSKKVDKAKEIYEKLITATAPSTPPLVWIQYMRFSRRHERIEGPRKVFKRAKSSPDCTYHVYIALGFIEYYINQDTKTARDIFEIGLKKFGTDITFVNFYVDFLSNLNEENNTRVLFEKILSNVIPQEKSEAFWRKYLDFEYRQNQDLATVIKLEKRVAGLSPAFEKHSLLQHLNRYKFLNLWPCHPNEIEIMSKNLLRDDGEDEDDMDEDGGDDQDTSSSSYSSNKYRNARGGGGGKWDHRGGGGGAGGGDEKNEREDKPTSQTKIPLSTLKASRPDTSAMILYRNEMGKISARGGGGGIGGSGEISPPIQSINVPPNNMPPGIMGGGMGGGVMGGMVNGIPDFLMPIAQFYPPPQQFNGPWVDVDQLMMLIKESQFPPQLLQMMAMAGINIGMNPNMGGGNMGGNMGGGNMGGMNQNINMGNINNNNNNNMPPNQSFNKQQQQQQQQNSQPTTPTTTDRSNQSPPTSGMSGGQQQQPPQQQLLGKRKIDEPDNSNNGNQLSDQQPPNDQPIKPNVIPAPVPSSSQPLPSSSVVQPTSNITSTTTPLNSAQPISSTISSTKLPDNDIYRKRLASKLSKKI
ncbi:cleavage stimulation factor subunit 3 [Cavenderia fasciculata]|uniref:Cleavage stimulation factor subunit 3 n=1 Tax=Cavenderia fasciculata TaxID=261658 RepID=F4Q859_CACFS|nr:cleavage stimulation factor subunit 3 [Cavenderia fasciculata]EGG15959.1 cleavage stimulation factor subunit 3 [Cavenderia fasciculata]|eukprot:XP_004352284.1 cleavage stimulation factor subunit 3 [Cavenderia fasciculata]